MLRLIILAAVICAGCAATPAPQSLWGPLYTLGQAEQSAAPAIAVQDSIVTATWVGATDAGVHHDARVLAAGALSDLVTLPLPPVHPFAQQLYPAANGSSHLLWLDANDSGELRLYAALISADLRVERGPTPVTDDLVLRYTALPLPDGRLLVIWSGGLLAEPSLHLQEIDARGLPRSSTLLARDADWPSLARSNDGALHLFWLKSTDRQLQHGLLEDDALTQIQPIGATPGLGAGDRLHDLTAALDRSHLYLFWNLTRQAGEAESWMMSSPLDNSNWSDPAKLEVGTGEGSIETGFNSGQVTAAAFGQTPLRLVMPITGQFDTLPVAAYLDDSLALVYFQDGHIIGLQRIVPVELLLGPPNLQTDRERHLYLAWSQPTADGTADLKLTTTRR